MKSAGTNPDLWFVSIGGKTGFVNNSFLRETKIIVRNLEVVPYEAQKEENVKPDKVQHPHEVFEGTTIYTTEAAVNDDQQDSSTESPIISSNEDLTPSLNSAEKTPNQNVEENVPNQADNKVNVAQENLSEENAHSEVQNSKETSTSSAPLEPTDQTEASAANSDVNESEKSSSEIISDKAEQEANNNSEQNEPVETQQEKQELPKETPPETIPAQTLLPTVHGSLNSESTIEVPEKQDYLQNSLSESEQADSKEQNTSSLNNILENVQPPEETSTETNIVPNGNSLNDFVNPLEENTESPTNEPEVIPTTESAITTTTGTIENPNTKPVVNPTTNEPVVPPLNDPILSQINQVIPPIYTNLNAENQYNSLPLVKSLESNENAAPTEEHMASASLELPQTIEPVPPTTETLLPMSTEAELPTTTETLLPIFSQEPTTVSTPETIPPLMSMEAPPTTEIPPQESPPYTYTPAPYNTDESIKNIEVQEPASTENTPSYPQAPVEDIIAALPDAPEDVNSAPTEAPVQTENTEGFFSNMYSTVVDIWPSSTEAPEPVYNTEYPTYESEKADENEGFSFVKYFMSTYYSVMGTSEESKALFASVGELFIILIIYMFSN